MSDELIDRGIERVGNAKESNQRQRILKTLSALRAEIKTYTSCQGKLPLFIVNDQLAPMLPEEALAHARILPSRASIFDLLSKGGVGVEIGTLTGGFAKIMLARAEPSVLHLVDKRYDEFDFPFFEALIAEKKVVIHNGFSWDVLREFQESSVDWIYIDASHAYDNVKRDIEIGHAKIKPGGYLIFNDFTNWSPLEMAHYGVMQAICEFLIAHQQEYEVAYLALHRLGYHDIALRRK